MTISRSFTLAAGCFALLAVACGADPESSGFTRRGANGAAGSGDPGASGEGSDTATSFGAIIDGGVAEPAACATSSAAATNTPVYLVFIYDQSGSMKDNAKWSSCKTGIEAFFASPSSAGLNASMAYFPQVQNSASVCSAPIYAKPALAMRPLPDPTSFKANLDAIVPTGGTPTLPAVQGAIQYAQEVQAQHGRDGKVAIVLVTDGDPNDCASNETNVAAALAAVKATIPTYVIGVGPSTTKLNTIATGGGTAPAIIVQTTNPTQIATDFEKAINQIKAQALSCEYAMAKPANGATLDVNAVNVVFTPRHGSGPQTLQYNEACTGGAGWRYDDPKSPTKINICATSCTALKAEAGGKVDIVFGCKTEGGGPVR